MRVFVHIVLSFVIIVAVSSGCFHPHDDNTTDVSLSPFGLCQLEDSIVFFVNDTQEKYPDLDLTKLEVFLHEGEQTIITATISLEFGIPVERIKSFGGCQFLGKKMIVYCDSESSSLLNFDVLDPTIAFEFIGEDVLIGLNQEAQGIIKEWNLINDSTLILNNTIKVRMTN